MRSSLRTACARFALFALVGTLGASSARAQAAPDSAVTVRARAGWLSRLPALHLDAVTNAVPQWACAQHGPCRLDAISVAQWIGLPEGTVSLDSADQAAYFAEVMGRADVRWEFRVQSRSDTVLFVWSADSLRFAYAYDPASDGVIRSFNGPRIYGRAEIRDPHLLAALLGGNTLEIHALDLTHQNWYGRETYVKHATNWMRNLQEADKKLAASAKAGTGGMRNAASGAP
jgi:hypothetical protein